MTRKAYAKINLGLRVLDRRPDGYHNLETCFTRVVPADTLEFFPAENLSLELAADSTVQVPVDDSNLVTKAANVLKSFCGVGTGARIVLHKQIPAGAGLGGGSSDAASTLTGLVQFWNCSVTAAQLAPLALSLGSDVPYFLAQGPAIGTGRGEILTAIELTLPYWIVVVHPGIHISTPWAYANLPANRRMDRDPLADLLPRIAGAPSRWNGVINNDFEEPVFAAYPVVMNARDVLLSHGASFAQLSGSGSAVYGIFEREPDTRRLAENFPPDHRLFVTPPGAIA